MDDAMRNAVATVVGKRSVVPLNVEILTAAGFDPERTATDYEGTDWGLETDGDLAEASVYRHVPLKYLVPDDVNLMLHWGATADPLVELALHRLDANPFAATNGLTYSAMLTNVAEALSPPPAADGATPPIPAGHRYRDRLAAVCRLARAMIADGRVRDAAADLYEDPEAMLRVAEARLG
jgi:hypothetical protein